MSPDSMITEITVLGEAKIPTPVQKFGNGNENISFVSDDHRVVIEVQYAEINRMVEEGRSLPCFELAGPTTPMVLVIFAAFATACKDLLPAMAMN